MKYSNKRYIKRMGSIVLNCHKVGKPPTKLGRFPVLERALKTK